MLFRSGTTGTEQCPIEAGANVESTLTGCIIGTDIPPILIGPTVNVYEHEQYCKTVQIEGTAQGIDINTAYPDCKAYFKAHPLPTHIPGESSGEPVGVTGDAIGDAIGVTGATTHIPGEPSGEPIGVTGDSVGVTGATPVTKGCVCESTSGPMRIVTGDSVGVIGTSVGVTDILGTAALAKCKGGVPDFSAAEAELLKAAEAARNAAEAAKVAAEGALEGAKAAEEGAKTAAEGVKVASESVVVAGDTIHLAQSVAQPEVPKGCSSQIGGVYPYKEDAEGVMQFGGEITSGPVEPSEAYNLGYNDGYTRGYSEEYNRAFNLVPILLKNMNPPSGQTTSGPSGPTPYVPMPTEVVTDVATGDVAGGTDVATGEPVTSQLGGSLKRIFKRGNTFRQHARLLKTVKDRTIFV